VDNAPAVFVLLLVVVSGKDVVPAGTMYHSYPEQLTALNPQAPSTAWGHL